MRRTTTMLLALFLTLFSVDALEAQIQWGAKAGINFATLDFEEETADSLADHRLGFIGGLFFTFMPNNFISFQPEVLVAQAGAVFPDEEDLELKLAYIQVPLLARVNLGSENGFIRPHLALGPYFAYNYDCDIAAGANAQVECSGDQLGEGEAEDWDYGGTFGAGLSFKGSRGTLLIDGRYNLGLADVFSDGDPDEDIDIKNRYWSVMIGFGFGM